MLNILQEILNIQPDEDSIALLEEEVVIAHFMYHAELCTLLGLHVHVICVHHYSPL